MQLAPIRPGDVVRVDKKGRRFMAAVTGRELGDSGRTRLLNISPLDRHESFRTATATEVIGHWRASKATQARGLLAEVR